MKRILSLATIGLGLGAPAMAQSVDELLPADTLFVISVDDCQAYQASLQEMPLSKLMHSEEVVAFLEQPKAAVVSAIDGLKAQLQQQPGFENFDLSLEQLMAGDYGRVFLAITHFALPDPQSGVEFPDIGLVIGWEGKNGAPDWQGLLKECLTRGLQAAAPNWADKMSFQAVTHDGFTYEELVGGDEQRPPVLMGKIGDLQLLSLSHTSMTGIMARSKGGVSGVLASHPDYKSARKSLAVDGSNVMRSYIAVSSMLRVAGETAKMILAKENESEMIPLVDTILDKTGLLNMRAIVSASTSVGGVAHTKGFVGMEGEPKGILALQSKQPIDMTHLATIPKRVGSFGIGMADLGALYDFVTDMVHEIDADSYEEMMGGIQGLGAAIGGDQPIDLRNDLLGNMGPEFMYIMPQSASAMVPAVLISIEVREGATVMNSIQKIFDFIAAQDPNAPSARVSTYKGSDILQIQLPPEAQLPISPCMTVTGDKLMISLSLGELKRHLRFIEKEMPNVTENEDFQRFFSRIPEGAKLTSLSYSDIKGGVEGGYGQIVTVLPALTMMSGMELPFDMALMPTADTVSENFFGALSYSMMTKEGAVTEAFGPIGGEAAAFLGAGVAGGLAVAALMGSASELEPVVEVDFSETTMVETDQDAEAVRQDLKSIRAGISLYKISHTSYPRSLSDLLTPTDDYEQGYLGSSTLPVDPWGNGYNYRVEGKGCLIWSNGPNGVDEGGAGDDISRQ